MAKKTKQQLQLTPLVKVIALSGNALYILWIAYNGLSEGFQGTPIQIVTYLLLLFLLVINIYLLVSKE